MRFVMGVEKIKTDIIKKTRTVARVGRKGLYGTKVITFWNRYENERVETRRQASTKNSISIKIDLKIVFVGIPNSPKRDVFPKKDQIAPGTNLLSSDISHR